MRTALTMALVGVWLTIGQARADNWIDDADFEADAPSLWEGGVIDHEMVHAGRGALRVDMPAGETSFSAPYADGIDVSQSQAEPILAAFWLRPEAAEQTGSVRGGVTFHVDFRDGTMLAWYGPFEFSPEESGSWVYHEARWMPRAPIARIRPYVYMRGFEGSIYLDDIYLGPVADLPVVERTTIPVSVTGMHGRFTDWPRFEITGFRPIAHVFHCDGPEHTNLELTCEIDVTRTAPIYLTSAWGSQYWTLYSTDHRELAEIYTDERLDLSEPGAHTFPVRMSGTTHANAGDLAPGGWVFVTDRFKSFLIYSTEKPEGEPYEDARTGQTFSFWDAVRLERLSRALGPWGVTAAFSLADLSEYELQASAQSADGGVRVRPVLRDAGGNIVPLHNLTLTVRAGDRRAPAQEEVAPDGVPTGAYLWPMESDPPQSVQVAATVRLATPDGLVEEPIDATVTVGAARPQTASPPRLELLGWGSGHYGVSPTPGEGPESIGRLIADARAAGVTRLVVGARGTDGDRYMSEISRGERPQYDQLAVAVAEGERQGVAIYAGYALGWAQEVDLEAHPDWAMMGSDGTPGTWYCYNNPQVRAFHSSLVAEIVRNYDVAGVALDACRPGPGCHCELCARLFRERYGRSLADVDHYDPDWRQFQRQSITEYMRQLRDAVGQARPDAELSGYVWSRLAPDADRAGQDWPRWLNEGIMDWVCVGQYTPSAPLFRGESHTLRTIADRELGGDTSRIFPLLGVTYIQGAWPSYPLADAVIDQQLQAARAEGMRGAGYFPFYGIRTHRETSAAHSRQ
ncbi:MAG: family 10 glycosylhydrolase [Armatimonadota bacterium]